MRDRVFLWKGVVGVVAIAVGWVMGVVAQRLPQHMPAQARLAHLSC